MRTTRRVVSELLAPLIGLALSAACAPFRPPVENSGPAHSPRGINLAVTGQACSQTVDPDFYDEDLVEERLELQVQNTSADPVTIHRDAFRLVTPAGVNLKPMTWQAADPITTNGGDTRRFELRFMTKGGLQCTDEMNLDPGGGVTQSARPIKLEAIRFVPSRV